MTRVIAAIDVSAATAAVLEVAAAFSRRLGSHFEVIHVDEGDAAGARAIARAHEVDVTVLSGDPWTVLEDVADQPDVRLVVIGLRGKPGARQPAGSTAMHLIETVTRPIVLVPPRADVTWRLLDAAGGTVLMPVEGSESMSRSVQELTMLLREARMEVRLLHVFDEEHVPRFLDQPHHALPAWTREFVARHADTDVIVETRAGRPETAVLDCAKEVGADLLALPCRHHRHEHGRSLVLHVLAQTSTPVVLFPPPDRAAREELLEPVEGALARAA